MITRLPLKVQIIDQPVIDVIRNPVPRAHIIRIKVGGVERTDKISSFTISFSKNAIPSCNLTIPDIAGASLFALGASLLVELGYKVSGTDKWFTAFTGKIGKRKKSYSGPQPNSFSIENKGMTGDDIDEEYDPCDPPVTEDEILGSGTRLQSARVFTGLQQGSLFLKWKNDTISRDVLVQDPGSCDQSYESQEIELPTGHIDCVNGRWQNVPFWFPTFSVVTAPITICDSLTYRIGNRTRTIRFPGKCMQMNFSTMQQAVDHARALKKIKDEGQECVADDPNDDEEWWETPEGEFILGAGGAFGGTVAYNGDAVFEFDADLETDSTKNEGRFEIPYDPYVGLETIVTFTDAPLSISDTVKVDSYNIDYDESVGRLRMRGKGTLT